MLGRPSFSPENISDPDARGCQCPWMGISSRRNRNNVILSLVGLPVEVPYYKSLEERDEEEQRRGVQIEAPDAKAAI